MEFKQSIVTLNFIKAFNVLREGRFFRSNAEFAKSLDYSRQSLNSILQGKRDVTIDLLMGLFKKYDINPNYIFDTSNGISNAALKIERPTKVVSSNSEKENELIEIWLTDVVPYRKNIRDAIEALKKLKVKNVELLLEKESKQVHALYEKFEKDVYSMMERKKFDDIDNCISKMRDFKNVFEKESYSLSWEVVQMVLDPKYSPTKLYDTVSGIKADFEKTKTKVAK